MIKKRNYILLCVISMIITVFIDLICIFVFNKETPYYICLIIYVLIIIISIIVYKNKKYLKIIKNILLFSLIMIFVIAALWKIYAISSKYDELKNDKTKLYSNHNILLIVPHEDDEINILGGVIEQYVDYHSKVSIVFVTNGDYSGTNSGLERINEAINVCTDMGVCEENVYFLGYGDQWDKNYSHIYNSIGDDIVVSHSKNTKTYSIDNHPVYKTVDYTFNNYLSNMKSIILDLKPDIIFCVDYDNHIDHKATSLIFEKALGIILKDNKDYHPIVYKGFAYSTSWEAIDDYYEDNISSSKNPQLNENDIMSEHNIYKWSDRKRFPIKSSLISRSLYESKAYQTLSNYNSQLDYIKERASSMINGDKVFWERSTSSILYDASIVATSGDSSLLNDFMLIENNDLINNNLSFIDGTWIPSDEEKRIDVTLKEVKNIETIVLYDNPSETSNIINGKIVFDDEESINFGQLDKYGTGSSINIGKENVKSFSIYIESYEGENVGLTEIEAYSNNEKNNINFIKIIDEDNNFVYDYLTKEQANVFGVYSSNIINNEDYSVFVDNDKCEVSKNNGKIVLLCPKGQSTYLTVKYNNISDTIFVSNPIINVNGYFQLLDKHIVHFNIKKSVIYRLLEDIFDL